MRIRMNFMWCSYPNSAESVPASLAELGELPPPLEPCRPTVVVPAPVGSAGARQDEDLGAAEGPRLQPESWSWAVHEARSGLTSHLAGERHPGRLDGLDLGDQGGCVEGQPPALVPDQV